ncbi:MAG: hypothetical protein GX270_11860 [Clostridiaceae bacterium]|nr:hypothetical protein [Clostridiaceae bacterium]
MKIEKQISLAKGDYIRLGAETKIFEENNNNYSAYVIVEYDVRYNN